jgi:pyrimidine operon attenuation protein/uracil phosphoribosyltransferase
MRARQVMDALAVERALRRIAHEIVEKNRGVDDVMLVGITRRGEPLAQRLAAFLTAIEHPARPVPAYGLDIGPWRDDRPPTAPPPLPFSTAGAVVVLVDDVIWTGRSARAGLDALTAAGRPRRVQLAVLVDRGHRELPIRPDFVGKNLPTSAEERVQVVLREVDGEDDAVFITDWEDRR